jgi:hypothetical protein
MSHAVFLQYYIGTCKNNTSPKITLVLKYRFIRCYWNITVSKNYILANCSWVKMNQAQNK